jgi:hypothetical protein
MKLKMIAFASVAIASFTLAKISIAQLGTGSAPTSTGERSLAAAPAGEVATVNEFRQIDQSHESQCWDATGRLHAGTQRSVR